MPRSAADPKYRALERRVHDLEQIVAILVKAMEDEADADDAPLEDLSGNRIERQPTPHEHAGL